MRRQHDWVEAALNFLDIFLTSAELRYNATRSTGTDGLTSHRLTVMKAAIRP
jgi:hypothetical protein